MTSQDPCLSQVPFSITLPSTFQDGDNSPALPPSYCIKGLQELVVKYQLHFIVTRARHQKLQDIWLKKQQYVYILASVSFPFYQFPLQRQHPFQICASNTCNATYFRYSLLFLICQNVPRGMASSNDMPRDAAFRN